MHKIHVATMFKTNLKCEEDDGEEAHPGVQGVQVANGLQLSLLVLVLK